MSHVDVPKSQAFGRQREAHGLALTRLQHDPIKVLEFQNRARNRADFIADIQLYDLASCPLAGVGYVHKNGDRMGRRNVVLFEAGCRNVETCIAKTETEREKRLPLAFEILVDSADGILS